MSKKPSSLLTAAIESATPQFVKDFIRNRQFENTMNKSDNTTDEVEDLTETISWLDGNNHRFGALVHNVLTPQECQTLMDRSEQVGYEQALVNVGGGRQVAIGEVRNNDRCIIDDPDYAEMLYQRLLLKLQDHPNVLGPMLNWKHLDKQYAVGLNERLRILRYDPGTYFAPHSDGYYVRRNEAGPSRRGETSRVTLLLYLNEGYQGGNTRMLRTFNPSSKGRDIVPRAGSVLLFEHECLHEGVTLEKGRKYVVRTDLMYSEKGPGNEYSKGLYQDKQPAQGAPDR
ncbi:P4Hc [Seminavis robusta]|uniref:P4Hc n=1 Tax=Seminavis robusta TaxID=568900 RepID=A0A9N8E9C3_9STRA|nr:P4Hc [Seminavis robusta]|eukprot:Sro652_g181710.1 P4Hc (285) ;mRNA; r:14646-15500